MSKADQHKIVILETNQERRDCLKSMVSEWGCTPFLFEKESRCLDNLLPLNPDLVISGSLSAERASRFINTVQMTNCGVPVVIISDDQAILDFIDNNGFRDVTILNADLNPVEMESAINRVLENTGNKESQNYCPLIIGNSPEIIRIKKMIPGLDRFQDAVLIQGESGTGKELMARFIHSKSNRRSQPFVKINVPQLPDDFFENELLLLEDPKKKGQGAFAAAHTGTLLLYKIGQMPDILQAKLLKFFEEGGILKTAGNAIDVRVIATTGNDLAGLVEMGQFRKDLFYRLNVIRIDMPPLRNRLEDIPALTDFFTDKFCIEFGKSHFELSETIKNLFCNYHWPGNVQELENLVKRIVLQNHKEGIIRNLRAHRKYRFLTDYSQDIYSFAGLKDIKKHLKDLDNISLKNICGIFIERTEKKILKKVLEKTNWNRKKAAAMLDISYKSLLNKIKDYNLN